MEDLDRIFATGRRLIAVHAEDELLIKENKARYAGTTKVSDHNLIRSPEVALKATRNAQLSTFVASLVVLDAVERLGVEPSIVAGHRKFCRC